MLESYHTVALSGAEQIYCHRAHHSRIDTVTAGRASTSLHVSENRCSRLHSGRCLDSSRHGRGMADTLCIDDNMMFLAFFTVIDDVIDDLFEEVKQELIELIRNHADEGEQAVDLLMVTKYFERIGDHATNIAEWVIFSITGQIAG